MTTVTPQTWDEQEQEREADIAWWQEVGARLATETVPFDVDDYLPQRGVWEVLGAAQ